MCIRDRHNSIVLSDWRLIGHLAPAMLKALVFAKFVLIGEHLKLGKRFEDRPLIWPILIKAALFSVVPVADMFETSNDMLHLSLHCIERDHYHRHEHTHTAPPDRDRIADTVT